MTLMNKHFHRIAMRIIFFGALALLCLSALWFARGNAVMGSGMLVMAAVALSNFYLHRAAMKKGFE